MMEHVRTYVLPAAFDLLPTAWHSPAAEAMLLAIGLQESRFARRRQVKGPARGFWQFEVAGVAGIMRHPETMHELGEAVEFLRFGPLKPAELHALLEVNDTLAAVCARCLLYTLPEALPAADAPMAAWQQYRAAWRPGRPRVDAWPDHYAVAWGAVSV